MHHHSSSSFVNVGCLDLQKEGFSTVRPPALLAVDPASRAVAVAAEAEHLALFHASAAAGGGIMKGVSGTCPTLGF